MEWENEGDFGIDEISWEERTELEYRYAQEEEMERLQQENELLQQELNDYKKVAIL